MTLNVQMVFIEVVAHEMIYNLLNLCFAQKPKYKPPQAKQDREVWKHGYIWRENIMHDHGMFIYAYKMMFIRG